MTKDPIKLLHVEDDAIARKAWERFIKKKSLPYHNSNAASVAEAKRLLESQEFDVIVADYSLGDGTNLDILRVCRDIPLIVVTGSGAEEVAVQAFKSGAYDYLIKDVESHYLEALPIAIEYAIRQKKLEFQLSRLAAIVESSSDAIVGLTLDGVITSWNGGAETLCGYAAKEIVGQLMASLLPPDRSKEVEEILAQVREGKDTVNYETIRVTKTGKLVPVSITVSPVRSSKGELLGASIIHRNLSERK